MSIPRPFGIRRGPVLMALVLAAVAVIPVAIAMACNPQAYLTLDKATYGPGDTVKISGSFFRASTAITVSLDRTGQSQTVTSASNGAFTTSFALPSNAPTGGYSVSATGIDPETGGVINGLPARSSFVVAVPTAPSNPVQTSDPAPQSSTPAASSSQAGTPAASADQPAAATRPSQRPTSSTNSRTWREPAVTSEPDVQTSTTRPAAQRSTAPRAERATANGRAVFGGSVAPAVSASTAVAAPATTASTATRSTQKSGAQRSSSQPARVSPQAAEQTAADDVWGAVTAGRSPSVLPVAGDGASVSSPRAGSQLALGIMMLGAGALALLGGLAFGEARRRRVRVR